MIRVLIVDDEPLARRGVKVCLRRADDVQVVAEAGSSEEALEHIDRLKPDLVFLDVELPGINGFEMLSRMEQGAMPLVIFLTAYDSYALKAFGVHAVDYVMKPIDDDRFDDALQAARQRLADRSARQRLDAIERNDTEASAGEAERWPSRIEVRSGNKTVWLSTADIDWIEASGDYVTLHVANRSHMIKASLDRIEQCLDGERFARIHRSSIVALDRVRGFSLLPTRDALVTLGDGTQLRVSRRFRHRLKLDAIRLP